MPKADLSHGILLLQAQHLGSCNLHTVLDCPGGTFLGAGVKTVVLFFEKGAPTRKVWYYRLDPGRNLGKTNPLDDRDLSEFVALQANYSDSKASWSVDIAKLDADGVMTARGAKSWSAASVRSAVITRERELAARAE